MGGAASKRTTALNTPSNNQAYPYAGGDKPVNVTSAPATKVGDFSEEIVQAWLDGAATFEEKQLYKDLIESIAQFNSSKGGLPAPQQRPRKHSLALTPRNMIPPKTLFQEFLEEIKQQLATRTESLDAGARDELEGQMRPVRHGHEQTLAVANKAVTENLARAASEVDKQRILGDSAKWRIELSLQQFADSFRTEQQVFENIIATQLLTRRRHEQSVLATLTQRHDAERDEFEESMVGALNEELEALNQRYDPEAKLNKLEAETEKQLKIHTLPHEQEEIIEKYNTDVLKLQEEMERDYLAEEEKLRTTWHQKIMNGQKEQITQQQSELKQVLQAMEDSRKSAMDKRHLAEKDGLISNLVELAKSIESLKPTSGLPEVEQFQLDEVCKLSLEMSTIRRWQELAQRHENEKQLLHTIERRVMEDLTRRQFSDEMDSLRSNLQFKKVQSFKEQRKLLANQFGGEFDNARLELVLSDYAKNLIDLEQVLDTETTKLEKTVLKRITADKETRTKDMQARQKSELQAIQEQHLHQRRTEHEGRHNAELKDIELRPGGEKTKERMKRAAALRHSFETKLLDELDQRVNKIRQEQDENSGERAKNYMKMDQDNVAQLEAEAQKFEAYKVKTLEAEKTKLIAAVAENVKAGKITRLQMLNILEEPLMNLITQLDQEKYERESVARQQVDQSSRKTQSRLRHDHWIAHKRNEIERISALDSSELELKHVYEDQCDDVFDLKLEVTSVEQALEQKDKLLDEHEAQKEKLVDALGAEKAAQEEEAQARLEEKRKRREERKKRQAEEKKRQEEQQARQAKEAEQRVKDIVSVEEDDKPAGMLTRKTTGTNVVQRTKTMRDVSANKRKLLGKWVSKLSAELEKEFETFTGALKPEDKATFEPMVAPLLEKIRAVLARWDKQRKDSKKSKKSLGAIAEDDDPDISSITPEEQARILKQKEETASANAAKFEGAVGNFTQQ